MKILKKMMQVLLAVFFFGLLATNTVFANTTGGRFVDKDNRKYYVKDDHKAIYWHKIDGKTYYFGDGGEMVVGWQYLEIPGTGYRDNLFDNQPVNEIGLQEKWYYFGQDGALLEQTDKQVLEAKTSENTGKVYGEQYPLSAEKRTYYFDNNYAVKTGWIYEDGNWYYLDQPNGDMKTGWQNLGNKWYYLRSSGARVTGWVKDDSTWYYLNAGNGDMKTGWFQVNGRWYYAYSSGALAVNTTVDGYSVNYNGEWVR
ncbi:TPA: N-acetylmuramoyl-L-alanine amidase family protein [Streptococcus pneumoniae]|nr:N-acetylmuramoyl-L-alanine amidase family protein [Streptococcus pneumoniae]